MNFMRTRLAAATLFALLWARPALAVIAAKTPPSSMFNESRAVVLGRITKVFPDTGVVEASATALSGESPADTIKIKIDNLPETLKAAKEGRPIILFLGKRAASSALHLADRWYLPEPGGRGDGGGGSFVVRKDREADLRQSYPGTTTALAALVRELKANGGKSSMLDRAAPDLFKGGTKSIDTGTVKLPGPAGTSAAGNFGEDPKARAVIVL